MSGIEVAVKLTRKEAERVLRHGLKRYPDGIRRARVEEVIEFKIVAAIAHAIAEADGETNMPTTLGPERTDRTMSDSLIESIRAKADTLPDGPL